MAKGFIRECQILKTNQFQALDVWSSLEVATTVQLRGQKGKKELEVVYHGLNDEELKSGNEEAPAKDYTVGVISEEDSLFIDKLVKNGWGDKVLSCFLSKSDKKADEGKRFSVAIFINEFPKGDDPKGDDNNDPQNIN